ncbi:MAG: hypothetical protein ACRD3Z_05235 [Nitrososphaerales archaeon]
MVSASTDNENGLIIASPELAVESIKDAQIAGADVSDLVSSFNIALDLIEQADKSNFNSCYSYEDCNEKAMQIFVKITNDARLMKEQAKVASTLQKSVNLSVYAPIAAFIVSVIGYLSYKEWKSRQTKRLLEMEIKKK